MLKPINGKMSTNCCESDCRGGPMDSGYRRVLWVALSVNIIMFAIELIGSCRAGSVSLQADALDFLGDAGNYALALAVARRALSWRASAALLKGGVMGLFGAWVAGSTLAHAVAASMPKPEVMGGIALLALGANLAVAALLYRYRRGDSQAVSVWLCTRNDCLVNIAVMLAGAGVWLSATRWPDVAVAAVVAGLSLSSAQQVIWQALRELRVRPAPAAAE
jgi:Co/Zn/Cd efflux system component